MRPVLNYSVRLPWGVVALRRSRTSLLHYFGKLRHPIAARDRSVWHPPLGDDECAAHAVAKVGWTISEGDGRRPPDKLDRVLRPLFIVLYTVVGVGAVVVAVYGAVEGRWSWTPIAIASVILAGLVAASIARKRAPKAFDERVQKAVDLLMWVALILLILSLFTEPMMFDGRPRPWER